MYTIVYMLPLKNGIFDYSNNKFIQISVITRTNYSLFNNI
jgi:hypothetical protein